MQYDIDGGNITVVIGEEAFMDVPTALNYIISGKKEIETVVDAGIDAFDLNVANKTTDYNDNASAKVTAYNNNATAKTDAFDLNASGKTNDFNDNYTIKKGLIDASVDAAAGSASAASASADLAQQWAVKMDGKVADEDYSAKYYADLASQSAGATGANKDLSNLTAAGEAKFEAKQDVISDLSTIRSGAALGATAVQPASLATVATSGSYNDLSNKPDLSVYAFDNAVVHLAGDETITGNKTFSGNVKLTGSTGSPQSGLFISKDKTNYAISVQNTEVTKGTTPSEGVIFGVDFYGTKADNQQDRFGAIECIYDTNKSTSLAMVIYDATSAENSSNAKVQLFHSGTTGGTYAIAPASDVAGSIVTTVSKSKAKNGYFKLGNGLIVQWGSVTASSVALTITLPTAFSSATSYSISAITNNGKAAFTQQQTSTTFHLDASSGIGNTSLKWIAIGY